MGVDVLKMAAGKKETEARTAWMLEVGALRLRCLLEPEGHYSLQARTSRGSWAEIGRGRDAAELLRRAVKPSKVLARLNRLSTPRLPPDPEGAR
jgi:hypothetical protein